MGGPSGVGAAKGVTGTGLNGVAAITSAVGSYLSDPNRGNNTDTKPKAYINYLLLDEQFRYVSGGFSRVGDVGTLKDHATELQNIAVTKNGYLYVYCSNESPVQVFFDNLQVVHTRGPILEETHYYPFGLTMAGISSNAAGKLKNKYGYNGGNELQSEQFSTGSGLDLYDAKFRSYDPQIGRFLQIDPLADVSNRFSPYVFANNNPLFYNDPFGLLSTPENPDVLPEYIVTPNKGGNKFVGYYWPRYSRYDAKVYDRAKTLYTQRRDGGKPTLIGGESNYYIQNQQNLERFYRAKQQGRQLQLAALAGIMAPVVATAIAPYSGVIATKISVEAGLLRTGAQMAVNQYGRPLVGATLMNIMQNGGDYTKLDGIDIATNTLNPYNGISGTIGMAAINSLFDYNVIKNSGMINSPLWGGKNWFQTGLDFSFGAFGEGMKSTFNSLGGSNNVSNLFIDVITGNAGTQVQSIVEK